MQKMIPLNTVTIESKTHMVRVAQTDDYVKFCCKDILESCGVLNPCKVIKRKADQGIFKSCEKILVNIDTSAGNRVVPMWYAERRDCESLIKTTSCPQDVKNWLLTEVLTYGDSVTKSNCYETIENQQAEKHVDDQQVLNRRIDLIIFELLELKKKIG